MEPIFNEVWRRYLTALRFQYARLRLGSIARAIQAAAQYVAHRSDLNYVISEMISS